MQEKRDLNDEDGGEKKGIRLKHTLKSGDTGLRSSQTMLHNQVYNLLQDDLGYFWEKIGVVCTR